MRATLEFDFDNMEDQLAHRRAVNARNAYLVIQAMDNELRRLDKYTDSETVMIEKVRETWSDIIEVYDVNLNDLE